MKVLIADDDPILRCTLKDALRAAQMAVVEASNGKEALEAFDKDKPDAVVLDIVMPDLDGLETLQRMRAASPSLNIIVVSGGGRTRNFDVLELARHLGATATIAKPFRMKHLVECIRASIPV